MRVMNFHGIKYKNRNVFAYLNVKIANNHAEEMRKKFQNGKDEENSMKMPFNIFNGRCESFSISIFTVFIMYSIHCHTHNLMLLVFLFLFFRCCCCCFPFFIDCFVLETFLGVLCWKWNGIRENFCILCWCDMVQRYVI